MCAQHSTEKSRSNKIIDKREVFRDCEAFQSKAIQCGAYAVDELVNTFQATGQHVLTSVRLVSSFRHRHKENAKLSRTQLNLGERAHALKFGNESIRQELVKLDDQMQSIRLGNGSTRQLEAKCRGLLVRLAEEIQDEPQLHELILMRDQAKQSQIEWNQSIDEHWQLVFSPDRNKRSRIVIGYAAVLVATISLATFPPMEINATKSQTLGMTPNPVTQNTMPDTAVKAPEEQSSPDEIKTESKNPEPKSMAWTTRNEASVVTQSATFDSSGYSNPELFRRIYDKSLNKSHYDGSQLAVYLQSFLEPFFQTKGGRQPVSRTAYAKVAQHTTAQALGQFFGGVARSRHGGGGAYEPSQKVTSNLLMNLRSGRADAQLFYDRHGTNTPAGRQFFANVEHYIRNLGRPSFEAEMRKGYGN